MTTVLKYSASEIVEDAFLDSGIIPPDQVPEAEDVETGFRILNRLLKLWQVNMHLWLQEEGVIFLDPGQQSYLLGPDGDEACALDSFIATKVSNPPPTDLDAAQGDTDIFVESTTGMTGPTDLLTVDPIDASLWTPSNEAIVSVVGDELVVTNGGDLSSSATFIMELVSGVTNYRVRVDNTSGSGEIVKFSVLNPNETQTGRVILSAGDNDDGQLGIGVESSQPTFTQEGTFDESWNDIGAGDQFALTVRQDGTLWATGRNGSGQLGLDNIDTQFFYVQEASGATDWVSVEGGSAFSIALKKDGTLWSSGSNVNGQLGTGTFSDSLVFIQEASLAEDWKTIACGSDFAMAIKEDGSLYGVGDNSVGQLGVGATTDQVVFIEEDSLTKDWTDIGTGKDFTMVVKTDGSLWGTGDNTKGQLGTGDNVPTNELIQEASGALDWESVSCGDEFSYAIKSNGDVYSTGDNSVGQLSNETTTDQNVFSIAFEKKNDYKMSASGTDFSMIVKTDGTLWGVGDNTHGQLGLNNTTDQEVYVQAGAATNWVFVACGSNFSIAINEDGKLYGSGHNLKGQLGDGTITERHVFTQESSSATDWETAACGNEFTVALKTSNKIFGTGENNDGQLGISTTTNKNTFTQEVGLDTDWALIDAGAFHTIAIKTDNTVWGTGLNSSDQLLIGESGDVDVFTQGYLPVNDSLKAISMSLGSDFTVVIKNDGTLWGSGDNTSGQLGLGNNTSTPIFKQESSGNSTWEDVRCGGGFTIARRSNGTLWGSGHNEDGELGIGNFDNKNVFTQESTSAMDWADFDASTNSTLAIKSDNNLFATGLDDHNVLARYNETGSINTFQHSYQPSDAVIAADAGDEFMMFIKDGGTLWGVGKNHEGQLGIGSTGSPELLALQETTKATDWVDVRCGQDFSVALKSNGTLWGCGKRDVGQYGQLSGASLSTFTQEPLGDMDWVQFDCGQKHTMAIKTDAKMWATGGNSDGQLGINSTTDSLGFVSAGIINWLAVACGLEHTIAVGTEHDLYGTGENSDGQLGDGTTTQRQVFVKEVTAANDWMGAAHGISAGNSFSVCLKTDGRLFSVGVNDIGQLGTNNHLEIPIYVQEFTRELWLGIDCGNDFVMAVQNVGGSRTLFGTGNNINGQLALGAAGGEKLIYTASTTPTEVSFPTCGFSFSAFYEIYPDQGLTGRLFAVGDNTDGQLGDGTTNDTASFRQVAVPVIDAQTVAAGNEFTVHVRTDNTLWGAGNNAQGQLGIGTSTSESLYVQENTNATDWSMVACGNQHTMAIKGGGTLYGTGLNDVGQLGSGSLAFHTSFFQEFLKEGNWTSVQCGLNHTIATTTSNTLLATGDNAEGQLGLGVGAPTARNRFTQEHTQSTNWGLIAAGGNATMSSTIDKELLVVGDNADGELGTGEAAVDYFDFTTSLLLDPGATGVGCGSDFTLVILEDKTLWGAGNGTAGQLGINDRSSVVVAQESTRKTNWTSVAGGLDFSVALNSDGELFATGNGDVGQLGNPNTSSATFVQETTQAIDWDLIAPGNNFASAHKSTNFLGATGSNTSGQLGVPYVSPSTDIYVHVHDQLTADSIVCGSTHAMRIKSDNTLWGVGNNSSGQLGINSETDTSIFTQETTGGATWQDAGCGAEHSMAIDSADKLYGTGLNDKGQLGLNTTTNAKQFTQESGGATNWDKVDGGEKHTAALNTDNKIFGSGLNIDGQLGLGDNVNVSVFTQESSSAVTWTEVACGGNHTMGLKSTGAVLGTGENNEGELGINSTASQNTFTQESTSNTTWSMLSCGQDHTMALRTDKSMWGTGDNSHGQLGIGVSSIESLYRQESSSALDWASVSCGLQHSIAIKNDGSLWGAGGNSDGELSTGDKLDKNVFTNESTAAFDWELSACGDSHSVAQKVDGSLWGSGLNADGQLGTGNFNNQTVFAREATLGNDWLTITAGSNYSVAIKDQNTLFGTGSNAIGQLGLGSVTPDVHTYTQEITGATNWDAVSSGIDFTAATQFEEFFTTITSETVSTDGPVFLSFTNMGSSTDTSDGLGETALSFVEFEITVESNVSGASASIDSLQLRDAVDIGDHIGIRLDDGSRFWSTIDDILSDTELVITDALPSSAAAGNSVFVFEDLIDRPLRIYNGRTQTFGDDNEIPVDDWSRQEYMQQPLKSSQGIPVNMYYTPELGDGRVYIWQTASNSNQLLLFTYDKPFEVTPDTASQPDIPVEWANPLKWAIAKELIPGYGVPPDKAAEIRTNAVETLKEAQDNSNSSVYDLNVTPDMR